LAVSKNNLKGQQKWRKGTLHVVGILCLISILLLACSMSYTVIPTAEPSPTSAAIPTVTFLPTWTPLPVPTSTTVALDFIALMCNADWMNGEQHLTACPDASADYSGGYARMFKALPKGFPLDTQALLMVPNANVLFLRYPSFTVRTNDRFRTRLLCGTSAPCDIEFALDYYDANDKYREFMNWDYKTGDDPIKVDLDLSTLAGQSVDFVLTLRLYHQIESPQHDNGLWVAPHIYRPTP
jgi:hypothetical protein